MSGSNKSCELNNHINIILLIMFVIVVAVTLSYKSCTTTNQHKPNNIEEMSQQDYVPLKNQENSTETIIKNGK